jgi:predicted transcriptional regulator
MLQSRSGWRSLPKTPAGAAPSSLREAISEYVNANEWQVAGIKRAMASMDRGEGIGHDQVMEWIRSWDNDKELPAPKRSKP